MINFVKHYPSPPLIKTCSIVIVVETRERVIKLTGAEIGKQNEVQCDHYR